MNKKDPCPQVGQTLLEQDMRNPRIKVNYAKCHGRVQTATSVQRGVIISLWGITEGFMKEARFGLDLEKWVGVEQTRWDVHSRANVCNGGGGGNEGCFLEAVRLVVGSSSMYV